MKIIKTKKILEGNKANVEFCRNVFIDMIVFRIYNIKKGKEGKNE